MENNQQNATTSTAGAPTKFCSHCGQQIATEAVICPHCGCQVQEMKRSEGTPNIVINNSNMNSNVNTAVGFGRPKNKWVAFCLCFFLGFVGAHKFYEGKGGMGILYLLTAGIFGIGVLIDLIALLFKPNPYYV